MILHTDAKGFELHEAQNFVIQKGLKKLQRLCKHIPQDLLKANVTISCHQKTPDSQAVFNSHIHLDIPGKELAAIASERKFTLSFNEALNKIISQLKNHKRKLQTKRTRTKTPS